MIRLNSDEVRTLNCSHAVYALHAHLFLMEIEVCFFLCLEHGCFLLLVVTGQLS